MSYTVLKYIDGYGEYFGPQCQQCGKEDYTVRYSCLRCDDLICENCLETHRTRPHREYL